MTIFECIIMLLLPRPAFSCKVELCVHHTALRCPALV